jgi:hypothetical protein
VAARRESEISNAGYATAKKDTQSPAAMSLVLKAERLLRLRSSLALIAYLCWRLRIGEY